MLLQPELRVDPSHTPEAQVSCGHNGGRLSGIHCFAISRHGRLNINASVMESSIGISPGQII